MKVLLLTNMYPTAEMPALGTFVKDQVESLRREGVEVDVFFVNGTRHALNYLWAFPRLWAWLLTHRYNLIHAHYVFCGLIGRAQFLYPVVLTHHGVEVLRTWQTIPCRIITPLVDRVIVRSQEMKEKLNCKEAEIIPAGIDLDLFKPMPQEECRKSLNLPMDKRLVLCAGRYLSPEKRFDIVSEAMVRLRRTVPDAELVSVKGRPHHTMPLYMNACDVLLLVSDAEGSPNVVKEAMACNLPIVSVAVGDVPAVIGGTEGCFICTQDAADVAERLEMALRRLQRTQGRENVRRFELAEISRRILGVYEKALAERKSRLRAWGKGLVSRS